MFMFGDFNYSELLDTIDTLIRDRKYGSYAELTNLTIRELANIVNTIINKEEQQKIQQAMAGQ